MIPFTSLYKNRGQFDRNGHFGVLRWQLTKPTELTKHNKAAMSNSPAFDQSKGCMWGSRWTSQDGSQYDTWSAIPMQDQLLNCDYIDRIVCPAATIIISQSSSLCDHQLMMMAIRKSLEMSPDNHIGINWDAATPSRVNASRRSERCVRG